MLNEAVINVLKNGMWDLATCKTESPMWCPLPLKDVTEDGKLVVGRCFPGDHIEQYPRKRRKDCHFCI